MDDENEEVSEPTTAESGSIKAIGKDTVHKICSGQVVLSLAIAVKELVENALDAGATAIEVKLRCQGLEVLEVTDNGCGVEEHDLQAMTAKYHTSKLKEFTDLKFVETFGFRGEALSSLCALADMSIVTRHKNSDVGVRIDLDHDGKIKNRTVCAQSIGTTVILTNLFSTLPVRRRDFTRNIKKEFNKMCQMLQAYCLVAKGVRIHCTNYTEKSGKTTVMQTMGKSEVLDNICTVFGSRQANELVLLKAPINNEELTAESLRAELEDDPSDKIEITQEDIDCLNAKLFQLEGFVSSCAHGAGRSAKDRQFFYINSRPCDLKNVSKMVNDIYRRYNGNQYPFVYLNTLTSLRSDVDVNLTPDKRQVLVNHEKILLLAVKKALLKTFGNVPSTYKLQTSTIKSMFKCENKSTPEVLEAADESAEKCNDLDLSANLDDLPLTSTQNFAEVLSHWKRTGNTEGPFSPLPAKRKCNNPISEQTAKLKKIHEYLTKDPIGRGNQSDTASEAEVDDKNDSIVDLQQLSKDSKAFDDLVSKGKSIQHIITCKTVKQGNLKTESLLDSQDITFQPSPGRTIVLDSSDHSDTDAFSNYVDGVLHTSLSQIELAVQAEENFVREHGIKSKLDRLRFKSEINPSKNATAEAELEKEISKQHFQQMEIIGQFNLGFIIVKLDMDLFIVDQHASDEKYNFEMLQRTTVLQHQPLAMPHPLELTAVNEMVLIDHVDVFEKNGFRFQINKNAPPTRKVVLLGKPISKNWDFGKGDIDELIFMLQDATEGTICRPSRVRDMLASRACRKSVMIGKPLNRLAMCTLIRHMGEIEHPWNCPHGRPTMRHLINASLLIEEGNEEQS